jgi:hypothetical protein
MIDLVSIVFRDELPALQAQAASINLYCRNIGIRNIYVVVNDDEDTIHHIDPHWWGDFVNHVLVVPRSAFSTQFVQDGWVSQQALKILAASMSYNIWSMVLDAKTIFVRDVVLQELIDEQGRARVGTLDIYPVFETTRLMVGQVYNIDLKNQIGPGGVPFLFHNDTVRLMIAETTFKIGMPFPEWFQRKGRLTEFMLYSGYVWYRFGNYDTFYAANSGWCPVNIAHYEVDAFDQKLAHMHDSQVLTVSIHRGAWSQLTALQQQQYRNFLISKKISTVEQL